jgi:hypothetical protein
MVMFAPLSGKKTYIVAGTSIVGALLGALDGEVSWQQAATIVVPSLLAAAMRHGISTSAAALIQGVLETVAKAADGAGKQAGLLLVGLAAAGTVLGLSACSGGAAKTGTEIAAALSSPAAQAVLAGIGNFAPAVGQVMAKLDDGLAAAEPDEQMACGGMSWLDAGFQIAADAGLVSTDDAAAEKAAMAAVDDACSGSATDIGSAVATVARAYMDTTTALQNAGVPVPEPTLAAAAASPKS